MERLDFFCENRVFNLDYSENIHLYRIPMRNLQIILGVRSVLEKISMIFDETRTTIDEIRK